MNYQLKVTETNNKSAKFHYQVLDENGTLISERKSNREYVACTTNGGYYFGRLDLIGKGDHGSAIKYNNKTLALKKYPYKDTIYFNNVTAEEALEIMKKDALETLSRLNNIAYKK